MNARKYLQITYLFVFFVVEFLVAFFHQIPSSYSQPLQNPSVWILDPSFGNLGVFSYKPNYPIVDILFYRMNLLSDGRMLIPLVYFWSDGFFTGEDYVVLVVSANGELEQILPWHDIVAVQSDDKLIVREYNNGKPILVRYFPDVTWDPSFSTPPDVVPACCSWEVQPDDKILLGDFGGGNIVRLNSDGTLDDTFPDDIGPFNQIDSLTIHQNGGFLVQEWFTQPFFCSARIYDPSNSFIGFLYNTTVSQQDHHCHFSSVQFSPHPDDGYVWTDLGLTVYRSLADGTLVFQTDIQYIIDQTFGAGWAPLGRAVVAAQPDGKTLFSGVIQKPGQKFWYVGRLEPDGSPDPTFGVNGIYAWSSTNSVIGNWGDEAQGGLHVLPDDKILVIGSAWSTLNIARLYEMQVDTTLYFPELSR